MHPCLCGCALEEHGHDPKYPGSTACTGCTTCIAYEADEAEQGAAAPSPAPKPPRRATAAERAALALLRDKGPQPADAVDQHVWPNAPGRRISSNGGGTYASQMLLGRMRQQGWVRVQHGEGSSIWEIRPGGLDALAAPPPMKLTRVQARAMVILMLGVQPWEDALLPAATEIEGGCFVGGLKGSGLDGIAESMNNWRDLTKPAFTARSIARPVAKLVDLGMVARVFPPDEPEGSDPLYVPTAAGAAEHRRRNPR
jgi:hypothetical protein